jgi:hypothetical protein
MSMFSWQRMSLEEYADFERSQGVPVLKVDGFYWRQVRPFFYRPLAFFDAYSADSVRPPVRGLLGGYQFGTAPGGSANSRLNLLVFRGLETYSVGGLPRTKRQQVEHASREFVVRPLIDVDEFKERGYPIYLSFVERSHYTYKAERKEKPHFDAWAESIARFPKNLVLGAYQDDQLQAISISRLVGQTVVYATMFSCGEALSRNVNSLLLHVLREAAAKQDVTQLFISVASPTHRTSVEEFFLVRGGEMLSMPAWLHLNPLARAYLRHRAPSQYTSLLGDSSGEGGPGSAPAAA